jgi:putative two-component system protein, hydrogenase maturation factor HypX/HoxX
MTLLDPAVNLSSVSETNRASRQETGPACLQILFLVSAHNGLSQRVLAELRELGHEVTVAVVDSVVAMEAAVEACEPELIVCPFLKTMIPESIWSQTRCLIVHPGPAGDRGPSSLDWAIELDSERWGVTVLHANGEPDAGTVLASRSFAMRPASKSSLYRQEVRHAAVAAINEALVRLGEQSFAEDAELPDDLMGHITGCARPLMTQASRTIDWERDCTDDVMRKIRAGDGYPGVLDTIRGTPFHLFGAHQETHVHGAAGEIVAQRDGAICRATVDGAVWITHLKRADGETERHFKLPATQALALSGCALDVPEIGIAFPDTRVPGRTFHEIVYEEHDQVGFLRFDFHNGAMSTDQCRRLHAAYRHALSRDTKVIVLFGGSDYFSNGIHLNVIEAADDPAQESWENLNAIDDLVAEIIGTGSHFVISALRGDAAAGGVPLALGADLVLAREDIVLNPYYQHMGGLYGSEYWTYLLPRRIGDVETGRLTRPPFTPVGTREAVRLGLIDATFGKDVARFEQETRRLATRIAGDAGFPDRLERKRIRRERDESIKPLAAYRDEELSRCHECFFGSDRSYHDARRRFVYKQPAICQSSVQSLPADPQLAADGDDTVRSMRERLRAATRYYERHVIAWYVLGRVDEARRAWDAIAFAKRALAEEEIGKRQRI